MKSKRIESNLLHVASPRVVDSKRDCNRCMFCAVGNRWIGDRRGKKKTSIYSTAAKTLAVGIEPTASRLTVSRSTNWAKQDTISFWMLLTNMITEWSHGLNAKQNNHCLYLLLEFYANLLVAAGTQVGFDD